MPRQRRSRKSNQSEREQTEQLERERDDRPVRKRRGRRSVWGRRLMLLLVLMLVVVAILPNLIGWTGMHQRLIDWGAKDFAGRITVERMTAGWFQPVTLEGIKANDSAGNPLMTAERITTSNRLGSFLWSREYGSVLIERPVIDAVLRDGGSNIEDAIAKFTSSPEPTTATATLLPKMELIVRDGTFNLSTDNSAMAQTLSALSADVRTGGDAALTVNATARNGIDPAGGTIELNLLVDAAKTELLVDNGQLKMVADRFDLAVLGPVLQRVAGKSQAAGMLSGRIESSFAGGGKTFSANFDQTTIQNLKIAAVKLIGPDLVAINNIVATGQAAMNPEGVSARSLNFNTEVGNVRADGNMAWTQLTKMVSEGQLAAAPFQLDGSLDIARLASMLPDTLTLHKDLEFESGELKFNINSRSENGAPRVVANIDTVNLAARREGQRIVWQQPLRFVSSVTQQAGQFRIEDLLCESDFLTVRGSGNLGTAAFEINGDLKKLMERLRQFATLDGWDLAGTIQGQFTCQAENGEAVATSAAELLGRPIQIAGDMTLTNPVIQLPGVAAWSEPQMRLVLNATAQTTVDGDVAIRQGISQVLLGDDVATLRLAERIANISVPGDLQFEAAIKGQLARWTGLVRNFVDIGSFQTDGTGTASALVRATPQLITASGLKYDFSQFAFDGYGMKIREDQVSGEGGIDYDLKTATITANNLTLVSASVAALADKTSISVGDHLDAKGQIGLRGDVHRIAGWFGLSDPEDTVQYFGNLEGSIGLSSTGEFIDGKIQCVINDLVAARPDYVAQQWVELLREPKVNLAGTVGLAQSFNDLKLTDVQVQGNALSARVSGLIRDIAGAFNMELDGTWSPDWQKVDGIMAAYTGKMVQLVGRDSQAFTVRGPLFAPVVAGQPATAFLPASTRIATELKWEKGNVFLLPVGPAKISAGLEGSMARADTGEIAFGGGTVTLKPEVDLSSSIPVARIGAGPVASHVQLTPEFCRDWMKYVAPLLADVTTAEGSFSVKTGGASVPLDNPANVEATGAVTLHNVTVGAGPLAQQLLQTVESVRTLLKPDAGAAKDRSVWMNLGEQEVPFAVREGRVFHEGLQLQVKDMKITTRGSVGLDQSLQMVAEIPIHDDWLNGQQWLEGLRGQKLEIPISGTVSKPVLDRSAIQKLTTQLVQRTAQHELNRVIGDQTQKLQGKATEEINQFQQKVQGQFQGAQEKVQEKLQGEVFKGLNNLFGPKNGAGSGTGGGTPPGGG